MPRDFKPFHKFESDLSQMQSDSAHAKNDKKKLDTYSRGAALGEAPHLSMYILLLWYFLIYLHQTLTFVFCKF